MEIKVDNLDKDLKEMIVDEITRRLVMLHKCLPMEEEAIDELLNMGNTKEALDNMVITYYINVYEHGVQVCLTNNDYKRVYLHLV